MDLSQTILETARLIMRPWSETDLNDFFAYASVPGVGEMAGWKHHASKAITQKVLRTFITEKNVLAIVLKEQQKVIGSIGLHYSWANEAPDLQALQVKEIGYVLSKSHWGCGYMPEAVSELIRYCFEELRLELLTAGHFASNFRSKRVMEKCGFIFSETGKYYAKELDRTFSEMRYILYPKK